jgi:hypothetical protein
MRQRSNPHTFEERLAAEKASLEHKAAKLKPGPEQDGILGKIQQIDTICMNGLVRSCIDGVVIEEPHFNPYSVQARICLGVTAFGAALFVAALLMGMQ